MFANVGGGNDNQEGKYCRLGFGCRPGSAIGHWGLANYGPASDAGDLYTHADGYADLYPDGYANADMDPIPDAHPEQHSDALPHTHHYANADANCHTNTRTSLGPSLAGAPYRTR